MNRLDGEYRSMPSSHTRTTALPFEGHFERMHLPCFSVRSASQFFMNSRHFEVKLAQWNAQQPAKWRYWASNEMTTRTPQLRARLLVQADNVEADGHLNAARYMREAAQIIGED